MKILVTYSSKTGNTKKLAEGIYEGLGDMDKTLLPMSEAANWEDYDIILAGYWVDKGGPNTEAIAYLEKISGKKVGIFATLAFWPDSEHGYNSVLRGEALVKEKNHVIGKYVCQGRLDPRMLEIFKKMPEGNPHRLTPEKQKRHKIAEHHPSAADLAVAAEMFRERIEADI